MSLSSFFPEPRVTPLVGGPALRWGVIAPGGIARDFTSAIHQLTEQRVIAVGSRARDRAESFARDFNVPNVHGSYDDLVCDQNVDVVYVAAPHAEHARLALLAIRAGKPVLVEKPFALSAAEGTEVAAAARSKGVFAAEAMWTRYLPQFDVIDALLRQGDLGPVRLVTADVGWAIDQADYPRMFDPGAGGGVTLDMGTYGLWFAQFGQGPAAALKALGTRSTSGIEDQAAIALLGGDGSVGTVSATMRADNSGRATIVGDRGQVRFTQPFVFPAGFDVQVGGKCHRWSEESGLTGRQGLAWQAVAVARYIVDGRLESPVHSLDDSISLLRTIDEVRKQILAVG